MRPLKCLILAVIVFTIIQCKTNNSVKTTLVKVTYMETTDYTGGPIYQLGFKNFFIKPNVFRLNDTDIIRIKFEIPPQNELSSIVFFEPRLENEVTLFDFKDTKLVGLDSNSIREKFMKEILKNRIDIYRNDSIIQTIEIDKEPIFEYFVGTEKELEERRSRK